MDKDYRNKYDKFKIATEILTNRYMLTALMVNINNLCYYLEAREKTMRLLLPQEQRDKIHKTIQYKDSIEFDRFTISSRFFNALVHKYGAEVVSYSCVQLDNYLKRTNKDYSPAEIRKRLKEYAEMYTNKRKASDALADAINITMSMDYKLIDTEELARQYIEGTPWYERDISEGCKYLKDKFNL
jgi:hypothetical protein